MSLVGKSIGRYRILEQLGQGGMAVVYKAYDTRLERDVALKVIRTENILPSQSEKFLRRFEREAKAQAKFEHPNIVPVHDYGEYEGAPYLVMAYRPGGTLKQKLDSPISFQEAAQLLFPISSALAYAHDRNVLHRDVKPSNILMAEDGSPTLTDFGIAKLLESDEATLTGTGLGIGTPEYMAPEQWKGKSVPQTDIYAVGVVLYELITGRKPYTADTPAAVAIIQATEPLPRPSELVPGLPEKVEKVLYKALALEPEDRYESMAAFGKVLGELGQEVEVEVVVEETPAVVEKPKESEPEPTPVIPHVSESELETIDEVISPPTRDREKKKLPWLWIGLGLLLTVIVVGGGIGLALSGDEVAEIEPTDTAKVTVTSTMTTTSTVTITQTLTTMPTDMPTHTPTHTLGIGSRLVREKDGMEMVYIPAGEFEMGASADEGYELCQEYRDDCKRSWFESEEPVHTVYVDAYWIDMYEVTNTQFAAFLNEMGNQEEGGVTWLNTGSDYVRIHKSGEVWSADSGYEDHPVVEVSWYGAAAYAEWVGGRLPTEAEWEKAARGGVEGQMYPWGNEDPVCTLGAENGTQFLDCGGVLEVGSFAPNGYGLYDMVGNVYEWVADWYDENFYAISPAENPLGPSSGTKRVLRGGAFVSQSCVRCACRGHDSPHIRIYDSGFRVVAFP
jgi:formylglycine-generating enzyme required for sulfatase activity